MSQRAPDVAPFPAETAVVRAVTSRPESGGGLGYCTKTT